jgi:hypothetical protein
MHSITIVLIVSERRIISYCPCFCCCVVGCCVLMADVAQKASLVLNCSRISCKVSVYFQSSDRFSKAKFRLLENVPVLDILFLDMPWETVNFT